MTNGVDSQPNTITGNHHDEPHDHACHDDDGLIFSEFHIIPSFLAQSQLPQDPIGTKADEEAAGQADHAQDQEGDDDPPGFGPEFLKSCFFRFRLHKLFPPL